MFGKKTSKNESLNNDKEKIKGKRKKHNKEKEQESAILPELIIPPLNTEVPEWTIPTDDPEPAPVVEETEPENKELEPDTAYDSLAFKEDTDMADDQQDDLITVADEELPETQPSDDMVNLEEIVPLDDYPEDLTEEDTATAEAMASPEPEQEEQGEEDELNISLADALEHFVQKSEDEDRKLNDLLNRLDMTENIKRMNATAREDMADVIERDDSEDEILTTQPQDVSADEWMLDPVEEETPVETNDVLEFSSDESDSILEMPQDDKEDASSLSTVELPKYEKLDIPMEPISQPLVEDEEVLISEYDEVPTISNIEKRWHEEENVEAEEEEKKEPKTFDQVDLASTDEEQSDGGFAFSLDDVKQATIETVHTQEIIKNTEDGQRAYHKITIR
ncbi:MAG: hypothetical protein MRZ36_05810 [Eubacterium sp.]|nr:hypothetical protein [Eubacterium sp.]